MASFVHLRVKSAYSLLEGAVRPKELADLARYAGTPAVAVTDTNNLFGVYEISDTLAKAGIQPIVGALLSVEFAARNPHHGHIQGGTRKKPPHVALLVQNEAEVAWIVGTHYDPQRDIQFTRGPMDDLEDASDLPAYGSKMGIDATRKWPSEGFTRTFPKKIATTPAAADRAAALWEKIRQGWK